MVKSSETIVKLIQVAVSFFVPLLGETMQFHSICQIAIETRTYRIQVASDGVYAFDDSMNSFAFNN